MYATDDSAEAAAAAFEQLTAAYQQAECPSYVTERTEEQRRAESFEHCLRRHGRDLDSGYPDG